MNAPMIKNRIGNTYNRKDNFINGAVLKPMTTVSPTEAPMSFIASTSISFPPPREWQLALPLHDSQALLRVVFTHAVVIVAFVTTPLSVSIGSPLLTKYNY